MSPIQALRRTVAAANAGNATLAKMHLQKAAEESPDDGGVWLWMGWFADSPLNATHCFEMAQADPRYHALAQLGLQWTRAMSAFKALDESAALDVVTTNTSVATATQSASGTSFVPADAVAHDSSDELETALVAEVAEVAAEVASVVTPTNPQPVAWTSSPCPSSCSSADREDSHGREAHATSQQSRSGNSIATEQPPVADPWNATIVTAESNGSGSFSANGSQGPVVAEATVLVETPEIPTASVVSKNTASSDWFTPSRAFASGSTRASLWGGLGKHEQSEVATTTTELPLPNDFARSKPVDSWNSPDVVAVSPASFATEPPRATATVQPVVAQPLNESVVTQTPTETPVWRAAKTDWFGEAASVDADSESESGWNPNLQQAPVTTARLADSIFDATTSTEPEVDVSSDATFVPLDTDAIVISNESTRPIVAPTIVVAQPVAEMPVESRTSTHSLPDPLEDPTDRATPAVSNVLEATEVIEVVESVAEPLHPTPTTNLTKSGKTVLVVDDSPTVRKLVAMTLEKRGFQVVAAFDGVAAIKEIATHNPDLILMDVTMPRLDGYQLCKLVKKHEATKHIPVVMLSGKDGMFDRLRGRLVGCSGYISKPFVPETLIETVEEHLAQAAAR